MILLSILKDFSRTPGSRYKSETEHSGEEFRENVLKPKFLEATKKGEKLQVNLDGVEGYPTSFLEEAFGGLAREFGKEAVLKQIEFISTEETYLVDDITEYINEANS